MSIIIKTPPPPGPTDPTPTPPVPDTVEPTPEAVVPDDQL